MAKPTGGLRMAPHTPESPRFAEKVRQIKASVSPILAQWGLPSQFSRWRVAQDASTGLVVLFGVLDAKYIAAHPSPPFSDYFDPRVLLDLALGLNVPVMPSDSEGLHYAFILDRGQLGPLPAAVDFPGLERSQLLLGNASVKEPSPRGWDKPIVVVDMTELDQPNERHEDYQALTTFQGALRDAQAAPAPLIKPLPALIIPNHGLASIVAMPTILAQVEAEVERRKALYQPWPGHATRLDAPGAAPLVKSSAAAPPPILLMMTEQRSTRTN
jgi:hypothetical protein